MTTEFEAGGVAESTDLLEQLISNGAFIIGDYHYPLIYDDYKYPFEEEADSFVLDMKSKMSLRSRMIFDLQLQADDANQPEEYRQVLRDCVWALRSFVVELVATSANELKVGEKLGYAHYGAKPVLQYSTISKADAPLLPHPDFPLSVEYGELIKKRVANAEAGLPYESTVDEQLNELENTLRRDEIYLNTNYDSIKNMVRICMDQEFINEALSRCVFVKLNFDSLMTFLTQPQTKSKRKPTKKRGFTAPGSAMEGNTKIAIHAVSQMYTPTKNLPVSAKQITENWQQKTGLAIESEIDRQGIDLTITQHRVMEGILRAFSDTNYKGNAPSISLTDSLREQNIRFPSRNDMPPIFKNLVQLPRIQIGQRDLLRLCGIDNNNKSEMMDGLEAITYLNDTQFCFYYSRLAIDENGRPVKDPKTGDFKKEEVQAVDKLFAIKRVTDEQTKEFKYYEITPSPIFLDQIDRYFLLVPRGWMEEVKSKVGLKRASSYTFRFLLYLRYQFEDKRRKNKHQRADCKYEIRSEWQQIAKQLKMPETVYVRNRKRALSLLDDAYNTALQLGYLTSFERVDETDILVLNPVKYPSPKEVA